MTEDLFFAAADVADTADLSGLIAFLFACYGAGTPKLDDYPNPRLNARRVWPRGRSWRACRAALLAHPNPSGGALAVIGHVERAYPSSFVWKQAGPQVEVFRSTLLQLLFHYPVGHAMDYFNGRYARLSAQIQKQIEDARFGGKPDPADVAGLWTACNDVRGYVVLGDPAVRIPEPPATAEA